jgi:hypothetical protein
MRKNSGALFLLGLLLLLAGCKKGIDLRPTDLVTEDVAFNSVAALQKGLNTVYARYAAVRAYTMYANALTSDEVKFGPDNGGSGQFAFRLQYSSDRANSEVQNMFPGAYQTIDMANRVLKALEKIQPADATETTQRNSIKAQLLALRAMSHFELLEPYSKRYEPSDPLGIPVVLESCLDCEPRRNSVSEVISQVEKDIGEARALLPAVTAVGYNDLSLNQISITAYQARIALYKREWQKASDLASVVIASGIKPLVGATIYSGIWTDLNTSEILFRSRFETGGSIGVYWNSSGGSIIYSPADKLAATYSAADVRGTAFIGTNTRGRYIKKYYQSSRGINVVDFKAIRTAEVYLIRAEAKAELNDLSGAATDINTLRNFRITSYTPVSYSTQLTAVADILLERYRELAIEGFRFYDLKRRGLSLQRAASDVDSPLWQTMAAADYRFVYPIPGPEMLANRNMVQNPGY